MSIYTKYENLQILIEREWGPEEVYQGVQEIKANIDAHDSFVDKELYLLLLTLNAWETYIKTIFEEN